MSIKNNSLNIIDNAVDSRPFILEMLELRGYDTSNDRDKSSDELKMLISKGLLDMELTNPNNQKRVFVKYLILNKIKNITLTKEINELIFNHFNDLNNTDFEIIIIIKDKKTDSLQGVIDHFISHKYNIQVFWIKNLLYNVLEHVLVPEHRIITPDEYSLVKKKYNIQKNGLPIISRNDPIAQYMGMLPDNVCEITRKSETSGKYLSYRLCV